MVAQTTVPAGDYIAVTAGLAHSCGLRANRKVLCWGDNVEGSIAAPLGAFISITSRAGVTCGVRIDRTMKCWGYETTVSPPGRY